MNSQTLQVLLGALVALFYAVAVVGIGQFLLLLFLGREARSVMRARLGLFGVIWFCFVMGQGILGVVWLGLSLIGFLYSWLVWMVSIAGWCVVCVLSLLFRRQVAEEVRLVWTTVLTRLKSPSWYFSVAILVVVLGLLFGVLALLPTQVDDALARYLVVPNSIANSHKLNFQPFALPFYGLLPLQIEMHWAALFTIANETAVTAWDYLTALSFLAGIALVAWALTSSRPVALVAVVMMLSTPAFYSTIGGAKPDNAASQYGMAAFLWLILLPHLRRESIILAGLCAGWALAGRYTNVIILPALLVFAFTLTRKSWGAFSGSAALKPADLFTPTNVVAAGLATAVGFAPMLIKNWVLVGCPLAPHFGCQGTFWADIYGMVHSDRQNISLVDLFFFPFIWTFASREDMLGNISPLFIGFTPFLLISGSGMARAGLTAGLSGLVSLATWLAIHPLLLYTRWLLVPLGLLAVPLSASVIDVEQRLRHDGTVRRLIRTGIGIILFFLLFQSRGVVHAVRYVTSIDDRPARYHSKPGYDVAAWLNTNGQPGERIALSQWPGYRYFVNPTILLKTESAEELQWLWDHSINVFSASWTADLWQFYVQNGFSYVVLAENVVSEALSAWPNIPTNRLTIAFQGQQDVVLRIEKEAR